MAAVVRRCSSTWCLRQLHGQNRLFSTCIRNNGGNEHNWTSRSAHSAWKEALQRASPSRNVIRCQKTLSSRAMANTPSLKQIEQFLTSNKLTFEHGHTSIIATCPICVSKKGNEVTRATKGQNTMYVNKTTGSHFCKQCGTSGTWKELKGWISGGADSKSEICRKPKEQLSAQNTPAFQTDQVLTIWKQTTPLTKADKELAKTVRRKFSIQKLTDDYLDRYQVHVAKYKFSEPDGSVRDHDCLTFPWYGGSGSSIKGIKFVRIDDLSDSNNVTLEPRQGFMGLFGWNAVPPDAKETVITLSEFDAIAVSQATSFPAVSLPMGIQALPPEVLPQLEQFEKIILWFGNDVRARQASNQFSKKLNAQRCHFVRPTEESGPASALHALNMGSDLEAMLAAATPVRHEKILTFHQLRDEVYGELVNADQVAGIKWARFPKLSSILKGHRRGELTIFTGPTGAGKTTLLSEISLDLSMQGVNTLWGSFEIRNVRLIKMMLNQLSGLRLEQNLHQYSYWAETFEALPMYFMSFYGGQNINTVIETMSHAAYVYDIEHVIVDNLQFMTSYIHRGDDKFSVQNQAIAAFRHFASTKNVHVTLVIHPRKENEDVELQTASIFGTAKASQEADNVLILQDKKGRSEKYLQVTKNRFDGVLGKVPLQFVRDSQSMSGFVRTVSSRGGARPFHDPAIRNRDSQTDATRQKKPVQRLENEKRAHWPISARSASLASGEDATTRASAMEGNLPTHEPAAVDGRISVAGEGGRQDDRHSVTRKAGGKIVELSKARAVRTAVNRMLQGTQLYTKAVKKPKHRPDADTQEAQALRSK